MTRVIPRYQSPSISSEAGGAIRRAKAALQAFQQAKNEFTLYVESTLGQAGPANDAAVNALLEGGLLNLLCCPLIHDPADSTHAAALMCLGLLAHRVPEAAVSLMQQPGSRDILLQLVEDSTTGAHAAEVQVAADRAIQSLTHACKEIGGGSSNSSDPSQSSHHAATVPAGSTAAAQAAGYCGSPTTMLASEGVVHNLLHQLEHGKRDVQEAAVSTISSLMYCRPGLATQLCSDRTITTMLVLLQQPGCQDALMKAVLNVVGFVAGLGVQHAQQLVQAGTLPAVVSCITKQQQGQPPHQQQQNSQQSTSPVRARNTPAAADSAAVLACRCLTQIASASTELAEQVLNSGAVFVGPKAATAATLGASSALALSSTCAQQGQQGAISNCQPGPVLTALTNRHSSSLRVAAAELLLAITRRGPDCCNLLFGGGSRCSAAGSLVQHLQLEGGGQAQMGWPKSGLLLAGTAAGYRVQLARTLLAASIAPVLSACLAAACPLPASTTPAALLGSLQVSPSNSLAPRGVSPCRTMPSVSASSSTMRQAGASSGVNAGVLAACGFALESLAQYGPVTADQLLQQEGLLLTLVAAYARMRAERPSGDSSDSNTTLWQQWCRQVKTAIKALIAGCSSIGPLQPLTIDSTPPKLLCHVLQRLLQLLEGSTAAKQAFVTAGGLMRLQGLAHNVTVGEPELKEKLQEVVQTINALYPDGVINYYKRDKGQQRPPVRKC